MSATTSSRLQHAKAAFLQGIIPDESLVRRVILESWKRSKAYEVPLDRADKRIISREELQLRIRARQALYDVAIPFMESLYEFTTGSGFLSILADEDGYVLKGIGDNDIMRLADENGLVEGCNRSEKKLGTNGIGTPLLIGRPVQVFADEHYYPLHHKWVCSGAPIFGSKGEVIGVFCLTGKAEKVSYHTLGMAAAGAEAITRQLRMMNAYAANEKIQQRMQVIVETVPTGILLVNEEMEITQINKKAARTMMLRPGQILGKKIQEVLGEEYADLSLYAERGFDDKYVIVEREGHQLHLSMSLMCTDTDEYMLTIDKPEALHKKVNRIVGSDAYFSFDDIVGKSPALQKAVSLANIAAGNSSNVLLTGESGTGKELFAQSIHNASARRDGPFVAINCGALPKSLIESELFGYEGGTFTGARRDGCAGKFELANGGTIFLDEIGDMPFDVQASLLRVLQNREVSRLGSSKTIRVDVRVIAATNKDLLTAIEHNAFRGDLYYRLNVFNIPIPPLRDRLEDVPLLADYFFQKYADFSRQNIRGFSQDAYHMLMSHNWRGNIRELENVVERAVYVCKEETIGPDCLMGQLANLGGSPLSEQAGAAYPPPPPARRPRDFSLKHTDEKQLIEEALEATRGNVKKAADLLGISRRTLYRKLDHYQIDYAGIRGGQII